MDGVGEIMKSLLYKSVVKNAYIQSYSNSRFFPKNIIGGISTRPKHKNLFFKKCVFFIIYIGSKVAFPIIIFFTFHFLTRPNAYLPIHKFYRIPLVIFNVFFYCALPVESRYSSTFFIFM